jgi:hypothetical protein
MLARTKENCRLLAKQLLKEPSNSLLVACEKAGVSYSAMSIHMTKSGPERFLKEWGGTDATPERVRAALENGLSLACRRHDLREARARRAGLVESDESSMPVATDRYLSANECQMLIGSHAYCGKPVLRLYCVEHDAKARRQEEARFIQASIREIRTN